MDGKTELILSIKSKRIPFGLAYDGNKCGPIHIVYDGDNVYIGGSLMIDNKLKNINVSLKYYKDEWIEEDYKNPSAEVGFCYAIVKYNGYEPIITILTRNYDMENGVWYSAFEDAASPDKVLAYKMINLPAMPKKYRRPDIPVGQWVSTKDFLPNESGLYIVSYPRLCIARFNVTCTNPVTGIWFNVDTNQQINEDIVAWKKIDLGEKYINKIEEIWEKALEDSAKFNT